MSLISTRFKTYKVNNLIRDKINKLQQKRLDKLVIIGLQ